MTYNTKIEELVGKHVAEFQWELSTAKKFQRPDPEPRLPNGYPASAYHPGHRLIDQPHIQHFIAHTGGRLSNGVPRVLSMELVDEYPLGAYNPPTPDLDRADL